MPGQPESNKRLISWCLAGALAAFTLAVYEPAFRYPFINYDDASYVAQNRHIRSGFSLEGTHWAFTTFACANWHPLTWLSLQLDATLFGGQNPWGYHTTNVLLHTANTILLFLALQSMTGAAGRSALVAGLFALHPLHVESVAWVAERKDVLSTFFWMLTMLAYAHYARSRANEPPGSSRANEPPGLPRRSLAHKILRYLPIFLFLALGLMAKPMLVTLPFVLLLLDYWPLRRFPSQAQQNSKSNPAPASFLPARSRTAPLLEKVPLLLLVACSAVITMFAQTRSLMSLERYPFDTRLSNALVAYMDYLGWTFWPRNLAVFYPHLSMKTSQLAALGAGILLITVTVATLLYARRWPYLVVGWFWYLGTLVPVIGLVQVGAQASADRYTYIPLIGIFLMLAWGGYDLARQMRVPVFVQAGTAVALLGACAWMTSVQLGYWKDSLTLWQHAVAVTPPNAIAHAHLGSAFLDLNRTREGWDEYRRVVELDPHSAQGHYNLGIVLRDQGKKAEAFTEFQKAVEAEPNYCLAHVALGGAAEEQGKFEEALLEFDNAIATDPEQAVAFFGRGNVFKSLAKWDQAAADYLKATDLDPEMFQAWTNLGGVQLEQGRFDPAQESIARAIALLPEKDPARSKVLFDLERVRHYGALDQKLPQVLEGKSKPANMGEQLELAWLCQLPQHNLFATAVQMYSEPIANPAQLGQHLQRFRYQAACAASRAGTGQGRDASRLTEADRERLRTQSLDWLKACAAQLKRDAASGAMGKAAVAIALARYQIDPALASVRDPAELAKLPEGERRAWTNFWAEVEKEQKELGTR